MTKLIHAFYNMDTNSVELTYNDGSVLTIDCEKVENHYDVTNGQMADLDWLLYNAAMEYAKLKKMLLDHAKKNSQLKIRLEQAEAQLRDRRIEIDKAGSLAEAAPQRCLSGGGGRGAAVSGKYPADQQSAKEAAQIRQEAEAYSQKVHADADAYWKQVAARASKLLADQEALRQLIQSAGEVEINEEHSKSVPRASNPGTARNGA